MEQCGYWKLGLNQTLTFKNAAFSLVVCNPHPFVDKSP